MIVCHCNRVNDRAIRAAVRGGAYSVEDVAECCGAAGRCGGCAPHVEEIIQEERSSVRHLPVLDYVAEVA
jgi:bacterioferritin-associated ferredoxin